MIKSLHVEHFRSLRNIQLAGFSRINLITGANNAGKSALLESLFALQTGHDLTSLVNMARGRGISIPSLRDRYTDAIAQYLRSLYYSFDNSKPIVIEAQSHAFKSSSVEYRLTHAPFLQLDFGVGQDEENDGDLIEGTNRDQDLILRVVYRPEDEPGLDREFPLFESRGARAIVYDTAPRTLFLTARVRAGASVVAEQYGKLEVEGGTSDVVESMRMIEPRLQRITTVATGFRAELYGDVGLQRLLSLSAMGDGLSRLLEMTLAIASSRGGYVLIDEIENGIHHSVLERVWDTLAEAATRYDVQIIATTHSYECLAAAVTALSRRDRSLLSAFRLERRGADVIAVHYSESDLESALKFDFEMR